MYSTINSRVYSVHVSVLQYNTIVEYKYMYSTINSRVQVHTVFTVQYSTVPSPCPFPVA